MEITELEGFQGSCFPLITRVLLKGNVDTLPYNVDASRLKECNSCCERYETRSVVMNFENILQDKVFLDHISYLFLNQFSAVIAENLDTARLCIDMILGCMVVVEMPRQKLCGSNHDEWQPDCQEDLKVMRIRSKWWLRHEEAAWGFKKGEKHQVESMMNVVFVRTRLSSWHFWQW